MAVSTVFPGNSDRHSISFCTPLSRNFSCKTFNKSGELICSEVKKSGLEISKSDLLMAFQNVLGFLSSGTMIPGEHSPRSSLSYLRFAPSSTQILLSRKVGKKAPLPQEDSLLFIRLSRCLSGMPCLSRID